MTRTSLSPSTAMRSLALAAALLAVPSLGRPGEPATAFYGLRPAEISIPRSRRIDFTSSVNGQRYSLLVALPVGPPPPHGYPVVYVIDGWTLFPAAEEAARSAGPAIVVGISYPLDDPAFVAASLHRPPPAAEAEVAYNDAYAAFNGLRDRDLTPAAPADYVAHTPLPLDFPLGAGGMDAFLKTIEVDIKPRIAALAPVDAGDQALFGHSLGGLAVLRALFTEPAAFRTFISASPSIWWNHRAILSDEPAFARAVSEGRVQPRVLITVGGLEQTAPKAPPGMTQTQYDALVQNLAQVDNAVALAAQLKALKGGPGYEVQSFVFAGEHHGSVQEAAISRGMTFAEGAGNP